MQRSVSVLVGSILEALLTFLYSTELLVNVMNHIITKLVLGAFVKNKVERSVDTNFFSRMNKRVNLLLFPTEEARIVLSLYHIRSDKCTM